MRGDISCLQSFPSFPFLHPRPLFRGSAASDRAPATLEMALFKRQTSDFVIVDDQSLTPLLSFYGNWTQYQYSDPRLYNGTLTKTITREASLNFSFSGIQVVYARPCYVLLTLRWK
jgi:hypothetical protein